MVALFNTGSLCSTAPGPTRRKGDTVDIPHPRGGSQEGEQWMSRRGMRFKETGLLTLSFLDDILDIELGCRLATPHGMVGCLGGSSSAIVAGREAASGDTQPSTNLKC